MLVVLGPRPTEFSPPTDGLQPAAAMAIARRAAARLVAEVEIAGQRTHCWRDTAFGQMLIDSAMSRCLASLAGSGLWGKANQVPATEFWRAAAHVLETGSLQHRAHYKPRGYAGDYRLQAAICEGAVCHDPLGRLLDRYFLQQAAPQAVLARTEQTAAAVVAHRLRVPPAAYHLVSVGSGPGLDVLGAVRHMPREWRETTRLTLLDLDDEALDDCRGRLKPWVDAGRLVTARDNLYRLAQKRRAAKLISDADFLICSGFFDYLKDDVAAVLLRLFWNALKPGGRLLVGNFAPHCPTRAYMEWVAHWYLIYRTAEDLRRLAARAGIPAAHFQITSERTGCDLFLAAEK